MIFVYSTLITLVLFIILVVGSILIYHDFSPTKVLRAIDEEKREWKIRKEEIRKEKLSERRP